ncbi:MAG: DUF423 domain-containing protein [Phyllobacteriaceae bacterium]|nr:DUF423 domain-containing protein [Phyllobacteriaceae bacterium]
MAPNRPELVFAGLAGAVGVAAAAASAHGADERMWSAVALVALSHAAAFIGLSLAGRERQWMRYATLAIAIGVALFVGDLTLRALIGERLFPMAAPTGGVVMIAGWLGVAVAALFQR